MKPYTKEEARERLKEIRSTIATAQILKKPCNYKELMAEREQLLYAYCIDNKI
jgi:hypothetical protein